MSQIWCFWKNLNQKSLRSLTIIYWASKHKTCIPCHNSMWQCVSVQWPRQENSLGGIHATPQWSNWPWHGLSHWKHWYINRYLHLQDIRRARGWYMQQSTSQVVCIGRKQETLPPTSHISKVSHHAFTLSSQCLEPSTLALSCSSSSDRNGMDASGRPASATIAFSATYNREVTSCGCTNGCLSQRCWTCGYDLIDELFIIENCPFFYKKRCVLSNFFTF